MTARKQADGLREVEVMHTSDETKALIHLTSFSNQNLILIRDGFDVDSRTYNAEQMANEIQMKTQKGGEFLSMILHGTEVANKRKFDRAAAEIVIALGTINGDSSELIDHIRKRTPEGKIAILYYMKTEEVRKAEAREASVNKVADLNIRAAVRQVGKSVFGVVTRFLPGSLKK